MPSPTHLYIYPASDKSVDISWQYTGYFTGCQIQYTTGGKTKTVTVKDGMNYYHLKGLTPGNIYSFAVRTLLRIDGKTYYSDWCAPRTFAP